ncbi:MAG TPA: sugar ABC transporter permease [Roseiflexaceae bacterium]|nr:sugar ABC transporter permease [Roseiflexaceae bacterium]HMP42301.1 sugar ABC transporter permease [Roseiflexaceae bacterium]
MAVQTSAVPGARRRKPALFGLIPAGKIERSEALWFWFFISPWVIGFLAFTTYPILMTGYYSLSRFDFRNPPEWVGLANYASLMGDSIFWKSLQVTSYYTLLSVPLGIIFGLLLALLLNQKVPWLGVFRTLFYLPALLTGSVAVALLFSWLLNPQFGIINVVIRNFVGPDGMIPLGLSGPRWLQDPNWVIPSYTLMSLWGFGASMLIFLSALQGVPTALYEAAEIDGASRIQQFFNVTIPMISPVILFTSITGVIGAMQLFTAAYVISGGNNLGAPAYSSMFYNLYLFLNTFRRYRVGMASAQAWILMVIILLLTLLMFWLSRRYVYYEADEEGAL